MKCCQSEWFLFRFLIPWYIIGIFLLTSFKETMARKKVLIYVPRKSRQVHHHHHHQPLVVVMDPRVPPPPQHYHYPSSSGFRQRIELTSPLHAGAAAPVIHHHHSPVYTALGVYKASKGEYHHQSPHVDHYETHSHESQTVPSTDYYGYGDHSESIAYPKIINMGGGAPPPVGHRARIRSRLVYL